MFLGSIFEIPAVTLKQDFWRLTDDENKVLTDSVMAYLKSLPKGQSAWIATFAQEKLPLFNLILVTMFILADRVQASVAIAKAQKQFAKEQEAGFERPGRAAAADRRPGVTVPMDSMFGVQ
jgi:hypothetical protein